MAVRTTQVTSFHGGWNEPFREERIHELNDDFREMGVPLEVHVREDADGFEMVFTKRDDDG